MSHISPVAPPPPPPIPSVPIPQTSPGLKERPININIDTDECSWAKEYPELQKGCYLSRVCQYEAPKSCQYYSVPSTLQVGPTCGLTALSMLLGGQPTAAELLKETIAQEYTLNGELFSGQYLFEITRKYLQQRGACQLHEGVLNCNKVKELLQAGGCLLVPYPFTTTLHILSFYLNLV